MIYLYFKTCNHCGLKYFGKTIKPDPFKYKGSGNHWLNHLKTHQTSVTTREIWGFDDQGACTEFALRFSEEHQIVTSPSWANMILEDGVNLPPNYLNRGKRRPKEVCEKISRARMGMKFSEETRRRLSVSHLGHKQTPEQIQRKIAATVGQVWYSDGATCRKFYEGKQPDGWQRGRAGWSPAKYQNNSQEV